MPTKPAKKTAGAKPTTFAEYFAQLGDEQHAALEKMRHTIRAVVPTAEEGISYGLAAFRLYGKPLVALGATDKHCAFYLMSNSTVADHQAELQKYDTSTGTIRFAADKPLPAALVKKLVKARIAENGALSEAKKEKKKVSSPRSRNDKQGFDVEGVLAELKKLSSKKVRDGMVRFAIPKENALGVAVGDMRKLAKRIGKDHTLAAELWKAKIYEARMMACFVDDPQQVTAEQMDAWCREFDSWAIVDTACFALFDRTPHAWKKVNHWSKRKEEFVKRAGFALLASLVAHDKIADNGQFMEGLTLVEKYADDERNFVKKGINWALRCIGKKNKELNAAAVAVAERLGNSTNAAARWVGKDALGELKSPAVQKRLKR